MPARVVQGETYFFAASAAAVLAASIAAALAVAAGVGAAEDALDAVFCAAGVVAAAGAA